MSTPRGRRPSTLEAPASASLEAVKRAEQAMSNTRSPQDEEAGPPVTTVEAPEERALTPEELEAERAKKALQAYTELVDAMEPTETRWVVGQRAKRLQVAGHTLSVGDVVPGADRWPRRDSWVSAGYIERG